jgi:hypothetical protein
MPRIAHFPDWTNFAVSAALLLAPWIAHYQSVMATIATTFSALILLILAAIAIAEVDDTEEPEYFIVGLWLLISPWILGFWSDGRALAVHVLFGVGLVVYAAREIWGAQAKS